MTTDDTHDESGNPILAFPEDDFCVSRIGDTTYVLDSSAEGWSMTSGRFATRRLVVYAEKINIVGSIKAHGKDVELYCNELLLGADKVTLDVSGKIATTEAYLPQPGANGQSGGNVKLFVQSADNTLLNLSIITGGANGQSGFDGPTKPEPRKNPDADKPEAGAGEAWKAGVYGDEAKGLGEPEPARTAGGDGGSSGSVTIAFALKSLDVFRPLTNMDTLPWPTQVADVSLYLIPAIKDRKGFPEGIVNDTVSLLKVHSDYAKSLYALQAQLQGLLDRAANAEAYDAAPSEALVDAATAVLEKVKVPLAATIPPATSEQVSTAQTLVDQLATAIKDLYDVGGDDAEATLVASLESFTFPEPATSWKKSALGVQLNKAFRVLEGEAMKFVSDVESHCSYVPGRGADGGVAQDGTHAQGGKDGATGALSVSLLMFDNSQPDSDVNLPIASAEQCFMLLTRANDEFFNGNATVAGELYQRLQQRLLPLLWRPAPDDKGAVARTPVQKVYDQPAIQQSSIYPMQQFNEIQEQAKSNLALIVAGKDMFGHVENWVPRLAYLVFVANLNAQLPQLEKAEAQMNAYSAAWRNNANVKAVAQSTLQLAAEKDVSAQSTINLILGRQGQRAQLDAKIKALSPEVRLALEGLRPAIARVRKDIQNNFDWDVGEILSAFASFTMAPSKIFALGTVFSTLWKSSQEIKDENGTALPKDNVVSAVGHAGNDINSMMESYHRNSTGGYACDDPRAAKLIVSAKALEDMIGKYKATLPDRQGLHKALDHYITLVQSRNEAVMSYNIALQMLVDAKTALSQADVQEDAAGSILLQLNARAPGIYYRSKRRVNALRLSIMRNLNYAVRSLRYFTLSRQLNETMSLGKLQDHKTLAEHFTALTTTALDAQSFLATQTTNQFPTFSADRGPTIRLTDSERDSLLKLDAESNTYWKTITIEAPALLPPGEAKRTHGYAFSGWHNVRITQVRVWLPGATVDEDGVNGAYINIDITHLGDEKFVAGTARKPDVYPYTHEPVKFPFNYKTKSVHTLADCLGTKMGSKQAKEGDGLSALMGADAKFAVAQVSPFASWRIDISAFESDNPGLDLTKVKDVYLEFVGFSSSGAP